MPEIAMQSSPLEMLQSETITPLQLQKWMPSSFGTLRSVSIVRPITFTFLHSLKLSVQHGASITRMPRSVMFFELWKKMHWLGRVPIGYVHSSICACVNGTRLSGTFLTDVS